MKLESGKFCPLIGKDCIQLQCSWFNKVMGTHPQTGEPVDEWGCAVTWLPVLLMENTKEQMGTAETVASFRNETLKQNEKMFTNVIENIMRMPILPLNVGAVAENSKEVLNMIEKQSIDNSSINPKILPKIDEIK
jgi:hypothetical protein